MGNALFIIWRESAEALLVIGVLHGWLQQQPQRETGMRFLWGGVVAGIALAVLLALGMLGVVQLLAGDGLEYFQLGMMLTAAALITHMVFWMRRHGRTLQRDLHAGLARNAARANWWGLLGVVALAVGRESAETVVFLYGFGFESHSVGEWLLVVALGIALAGLTFWLLQRGGRLLSWRWFFRISELLLLLLASALLVGALEKLIMLDWLPTVVDEVWDSSAWLDDGAPLGNFIAAFTGYRAHPALTPLLAWLAYWSFVLLARRRQPA